MKLIKTFVLAFVLFGINAYAESLDDVLDKANAETNKKIAKHNADIGRVLIESKKFDKEMAKQDQINKEDFGSLNLECKAYHIAAWHKVQEAQKLEKYEMKKEAGQAYKEADRFYKEMLSKCKLSPRATKRIESSITFQ